MNHYLDHAATTPMDPEILQRITQRLTSPSNPSSVHQHGQSARSILETCRGRFAALVGASADQVVFTASATEANNLALRGLAAAAPTPLRILTSALEHACIRQTVADLSQQGRAETILLPILPEGVVALNGAPDADVLALMYVQNETGIEQPMGEAVAWAERTGGVWLCDATQALATRPVNVGKLGAALVSFSSHKVYGPAGVGALVGPGTKKLRALITGGPQEGELRAGTQPVAMIEGFVLAAEKAVQQRDVYTEQLRTLTAIFHAVLKERGVAYQENGAPERRVPGFINLGIDGFSGADLVIGLDARGFSVSSGSACATGVMEPSKALLGMFPNDRVRAEGALRITPGRGTTAEVMRDLANALADIALRPTTRRR